MSQKMLGNMLLWFGMSVMLAAILVIMCPRTWRNLRQNYLPSLTTSTVVRVPRGYDDAPDADALSDYDDRELGRLWAPP